MKRLFFLILCLVFLAMVARYRVPKSNQRSAVLPLITMPITNIAVTSHNLRIVTGKDMIIEPPEAISVSSGETDRELPPEEIDALLIIFDQLNDY